MGNSMPGTKCCSSVSAASLCIANLYIAILAIDILSIAILSIAILSMAAGCLASKSCRGRVTLGPDSMTRNRFKNTGCLRLSEWARRHEGGPPFAVWLKGGFDAVCSIRT